MRLRSMVSGSSLPVAVSITCSVLFFGPAGRGAVSHVLAVIGREPPVERDRAVGRHLVDVHQGAIFAVNAFAHQQHRLVLRAFAPGVEDVGSADLRRR